MNRTKCDGCGVVEDGKLFKEVIEEYRDYNICGWCIAKWKQLERKLGRPLDLREYRNAKRRKL